MVELIPARRLAPNSAAGTSFRYPDPGSERLPSQSPRGAPVETRAGDQMSAGSRHNQAGKTGHEPAIARRYAADSRNSSPTRAWQLRKLRSSDGRESRRLIQSRRYIRG